MVHSSSTWRRATNVALVAALAVSVVALGLVSWALLNSTEQWKPLGPFPEQRVESTATYSWQVAGSGNVQVIPAVPLAAGEIEVVGTKCYKQSANVTGEVQWVTIDPAGRTWPAGRGVALKPVGCDVDRRFVNAIPVEVQEYVEARGTVAVLAITGCETPTSPDQGEGATLCWSTEPFALVP